MTELSPAAARRVYRMFCFLAWCDSDVADEERRALAKFREELSLSEVDAATLEAEGSEVEGLELGEEPGEMEYLIDGLIEIAVADGELVLEEQARLTRLAKMIKVPDLVGRMSKRIAEKKGGVKIQRWED